MTARGITALALALGVASAARADAVPDLPEPRCEPGFVVGIDHSGPRCVRPSCRSDADCPSDLRCTPRRCLERVLDARCVEEQRGEGAKGAPDPCEGYVEGALCDDVERTCPAPAFCPLGRCLPPDELPGEETGAPPPAASGGGCCGSRGARASLSWPFALAGVIASLAARSRRRRGDHSQG